MPMDLLSLMGSQAGSCRKASYHRREGDKQALQDTSYEDGASFAPRHRETKRPLGKLRRENGFYALSIAPKDREDFTENITVAKKRAVFLGAGLSPREVRTGYEGTQPKNCGFLVLTVTVKRE
jgi:hypothetical protein